MDKRRLHEAGTISAEPSGGAFRVCLIQEGTGQSGTFLREFFTTANAEALAGTLSFPGHPEDLWRPEKRNPLGAIAHIGEAVTIEEHDNRMGFWGTYNVSKTRPEVGVYLNEYAKNLALSIYIESDGYVDDMTGTWVATELDGTDPYRSVDLVIAGGAGGKFDRVAESLRRITETSATAGGKEVSQMEIKELAEDFDKKFTGLTKIVESLVLTVEGKQKLALQVEADDAAVKKAVESRLGDYDKAVGLIAEAKLTKLQSASLRALALKGEDVAPLIEHEQKVLAEARTPDENDDRHRIIENHLGDNGDKGSNDWDPSVAGFGRVN